MIALDSVLEKNKGEVKSPVIMAPQEGLEFATEPRAPGEQAPNPPRGNVIILLNPSPQAD